MNEVLGLVKIVVTLLLSFTIVAFLAPIVIPMLRKLKFGQEIREEGPNWHQKKSGTPTMGGIMFIIAIVIAIGGVWREPKTFIMLSAAVAFGLIGFIDDYIKVVRKRNLGLRASHKFSLQVLVSVTYILLMFFMGYLDANIIIPFTDIILNIGWVLYVVLVLLLMLGTVNSVNLTDGLDGLATSITIMVALFFGVSSYLLKDNTVLPVAIGVMGGCLGFLLYNKYPAKVFMGDTGSLFLGGAVAVMAIGLRMPLLLIIVGFVYLMEALSVILQVASFKMTGKRIFKMAPLHHHFEMCGWSETKIVTVFTSITVLLCVIGIMSIIKFI